MFRKKPIAKAISAITAAGTFALGAPVVTAEEEEVLEEIVVTGSRIPVAVSDAPRPLTVVDRQEIDLSGFENIADVLRTTTYNSIGSFRERSGSSFGQVALVGLRGLGEDRTAVLINGRRVPGNPLTGTSAVDLNTIPLAAVERIELLTDSASAVYGADAIGGVVNVIMRDDWTGAEFEIGGEWPDDAGADSDHLSFTFGTANDDGHILFSGEWVRTDPIFDADRDYSRVNITANPNGGDPRHSIDTTGVSLGGNTLFEYDYSDAFPGGPCPTDTYVPLSDPNGITGATACGFGYADISLQTGGIDRKSTFLNASYNINEDNQVYMEARYTDQESFGRYAPAVGFFLVDETAPLNPTFGQADPRDLWLFHRFIGHGNRDDTFTTNELDAIAGLKGSFNDGAIDYDVYLRRYEYTARSEGDTYVIRSIIEDLVADGSYNFVNPLDPSNAGAIQQTSATLLRDIFTEVTQGAVTLNGTLPMDLGAGNLGWAFGAEATTEKYQDQYDNLREAGNVLGSAGNSAEGSRSRKAAYGELLIPLLDTLEANVAVRYDDYDDFGSEVSPGVSLRFAPHDRFVVRASWGEGFKAPNLSAVHQSLSQSFETVTDLRRCAAQGIAEANCPISQVEEYTGGNSDLEAEQSESYNIGIVVEPIDNLSFSLDWFNIEIEDAVDTLDLQDLLVLESNGTLPPGVIVNRAADDPSGVGLVTPCTSAVAAPACGIVNVFGNLGTLEVEGLDLRANYTLDTDIGMFRFDLEWSHMLTYDEQTNPLQPAVDRPGTEGFPENRTNFSTRYSANDFTVNYNMRWIDEHDGVTAAGKYDDYMTHDITLVWHTPWEGDLTVGIQNFTDEDPVIDSASGYDDEVTLLLYSVKGRTPFLTYKHSF